VPDQSNPTGDQETIREAYDERLRAMFIPLCVNLGDAPVTSQTEAQCVERFTKGLKAARRARELALGVVPTGATS
jgi:hypothetical protein